MTSSQFSFPLWIQANFDASTQKTKLSSIQTLRPIHYRLPHKKLSQFLSLHRNQVKVDPHNNIKSVLTINTKTKRDSIPYTKIQLISIHRWNYVNVDPHSKFNQFWYLNTKTKSFSTPTQKQSIPINTPKSTQVRFPTLISITRRKAA